MYGKMLIKLGKTLVILCLFFAARPVFLSAQASDPFSAMERMFKQAESTPTPEEEYYFGRAVAANILTVYRPYTKNNELTDYLNLICQALVINSSRPAAFNGYHVMILRGKEFNAFATPGGHIFVTRGLVRAAASEDALAGIIAHELAHIMLRHGMKIVDDMKLSGEIDEMAFRAAAFSGNNSSRILAFRDSVNDFFYNMVKNGYSAQQEFEADAAAVELLAAAGYSPGELLEMLKVLQDVQHSHKGGFNDTHPSPAQRIVNVERKLAGYKLKDTSAYRQDRFSRITGRKNKS
jgi:predicted Zn-dependent protease